MMKYSNSRTAKISRARKFTIIGAIILAALFLYGLFAYATDRFPFDKSTDSTEISEPEVKENQVDYENPTKEQQAAGIGAKEDYITSDDKSSQEEAPADDTSKSNTHVTITSIDQTSDMLQVRAMVPLVNGAGGCSLEMTKSGSSTVNLRAGMQSMGSYSICKGFDVSTRDLTSGQWNLSIEYESASAYGKKTQTVEVR